MSEFCNILVVDDNQENLRVVSNYLKDKGYKIALAIDGRSALKVVNENRIDLILLDIMMPELDGFEVCELLKADCRTKEIPIIFLTAKANSEDVVKGFQLGGVDYITKPFNKEELYVRVQNHIQLKVMKDYFRKKADESSHINDCLMKKLSNLGIFIEPED